MSRHATVQTSIKFCLRTILLLAPLFLAYAPAIAQTLQYKAVYYRPARASLWTELANPASRPSALETLDQNFWGIRNNIHANAVIVRLIDDDEFPSQYSGGFTYDPVNRPMPNFSVAQELLVSVADKHSLKVIFVIDFSSHHRTTDDTFGSATIPAGAWDFIHALIDPPVYYGFLQTTDLGVVGLQDHSTRAFINDPRIAGWHFSGEWSATATSEKNFIEKYFEFFYNLVHWNGANTSFAGIYVVSAPDQVPNDPTCSPERFGDPSNPNDQWKPAGHIHSLKVLFNNYPVKPDLYGVEWYGSGNYDLSCISQDMKTLARIMRDDVYHVPMSKIAFMEGGSDQVGNAGLYNFYVDAINAAADVDGVPSAGISVWNSDGGVNTVINNNCDNIDDSFQSKFALAKISYPITQLGCTTFPRSQNFPGWHSGPFGGPYTLITDPPNPVGYGRIYYFDMTLSGYAVAQEFANH